MLFWLLTALLVLAVAGPLALALRRGRPAGNDAETDVAVYRDQLKEVERDLARDVIAEAEAERIRTEISRRLLAADAAARGATGPAAAPARASVVAAALVALALLGGGYGLYVRLGAPGYGDLPRDARIARSDELHRDRPAQSEAEAQRPEAPDTGEADPRYVELMEKLRATVAERPDDLQGQQLLARNEAVLGNFIAAHEAQARVISLKGEDATATDYADLADLLIQATGGYVSPEAERALEETLARDPDNGIARYFSGLMFGQLGRPDRAFRIWQRLLADSAPDDPWVPPIRAQIEAMADRAGERYTLPEAAPRRGPTREDMEAAEDMTPEERQQMIRSMVDGLSERLASEGGPAEDWARLINALGVLGERDRAQAIFQEAQTVFADDDRALDMLAAAADRAGLGE